ncbi:MAG: preprotein translocase subunit SecY [Oscillospiraceae bacterium]|nr:preprotein translocase subunit SecY [Oscillospiraceae bacterium]
MFDTFRNAWKIAELRKKLLFTLMILVIFRLGSAIPVPFITAGALQGFMQQAGGFLGYLDMLTGGSFGNSTLFALSVTPYINASIIIQLLTVAIPALERLSKEGESGRRKITRITRYTGAGIGLALAIGYYFVLRSQNALMYTTGFSGIYAAVVIVLAFTAGSMLIQWLGEQIDSKGIGNGISLIIFAGIVSRFSSLLTSVKNLIDLGLAGDTKMFFLIPVIALLSLAVVVFVVILNAAERRIPVQYAKRVVGRKMMGGQNTHIPIKVNMSGVMPVIFASALVSIPSTIGGLLNLDPIAHPFWTSFFNTFKSTGFLYASIYLLLIIGFNYFYVAIQYNPIEIANNLRNNNGTIPGYRPGKPTSDFITKVLGKITFIGALFLAVVAILPIALARIPNMQGLALGGTSLLILVGVALDTSRSLESYMLMRHHKGFLE